MRKMVCAGLLVFFVLAGVFTAGCVNSEPTYSVGFEIGMTPWEYQDTQGDPQGIDIDIVRWIADDQNFEVIYVPETGNWEESLANRSYDTMGATVMLPERMEKYAFVEMPFEPTQYIVIARGDSGLTLDDVLSGEASIAIFGSSAYEAWLREQFGDSYEAMVADGRIVVKKTADGLAFSVLSREVDCAVAGVMTLGNQLNLYQALKFLGYVGEPKQLGFVMLQDNPEFYEVFSQGMRNLENSSYFAELVDQYNLQYKQDLYLVGVDSANRPWSFVDDNGTYTGFDVEMMEWIGEQSGFEVEFTDEFSWLTNIYAVNSGDLDMWASSMAITPERLQYVAFSDPYYATGIVVGVRPDSTLTMEDFDDPGARIATVAGSTYATWLEDYLGRAMFDAKTREGSVVLELRPEVMSESLASGVYDFVVLGEALISDDSNAGVMKVLFVEPEAEQLGVAMANGNYVLQTMVNDGVRNFIASGKRAELAEKYAL